MDDAHFSYDDRALKRVTRWIAMGALAVGAATLPASWAHTEVSLSLMAGGLALYLLTRHGWAPFLGRALAAVVAIVAAIKLALLPTNAPSLAVRLAGPVSGWSICDEIGQMLTGLALMLAGLSVGRRMIGNWLALAAITILLYTLTAVGFTENPFTGTAPLTARPAIAASLLLLAGGSLLARPRPGVVRRILAARASSVMLRNLLPFAVMGPMLLGLADISAHRWGLFPETTVLSLIVLAAIVFTVALLWHAAGRIDALDEERVKAVSLFQGTLETAPDGILVGTEQGRIIFANRQAETLFGYGPGELIGLEIETLVPKEFRANHLAYQRRFFDTPHPRPMGLGISIFGQRRDGTTMPVEIALGPQSFQGQKAVTAIIRDVTERNLREEALRRRDRALTMLSRGNRAMLHCTDERQLLDTMCREVVEAGGYKLAWVGYRGDNEAKSITPMAQRGFDDDYLTRATITWADDEFGRGPTGRAIRTGQTQFSRDVATDPNMAPWREVALHLGFRSTASFPLKAAGDTFGALTIYSERPDAFDEMEVHLLEEMTDDLSFGIATLRSTILRAKAERELSLSLSMLETTIEATADAIVVTSMTGQIERYNQKFADLWRLPPVKDTSAKTCHDLMTLIQSQVANAPDFADHTRAMYETPEAAFRDLIETIDGRVIERVGQPQYLDGHIVGRVCSLRDVTDQKEYERRLTYLANYDDLTGLPNRNLLSDRLTQAIAYAARMDQHVALLFLDLDRFKIVNDSLGHEYGDLLLKEVAKRLVAGVRDIDTVARMGGDEFVILLPEITHDEEIAVIAGNLLTSIAAPYAIAGRELLLGGSIGIALYPRDGTDAATLLKRGDAAMYRAKDQGGGVFRFFTSDIDTQINRHMEIAGQLQYAMERDELTLLYQPKFDIRTGRIVSAEALIRWNHPVLGLISPAEFIPIAEESKIILDIGTWVADSVFHQFKTWQENGVPLANVALNLSARQLDDPDLPRLLAQLATKHRLYGKIDGIELEITEGMMMRHPDQAIDTLHRLKAMDFGISVDDFGTGYSSLAYLKRFPIDTIKIDRAFISGTPDDIDDVAITRAIIVMAHELGLKVVAEGVETDEQLAFLTAHGCDMAQGYLIGRPMSVDALTALLRAPKPRQAAGCGEGI